MKVTDRETQMHMEVQAHSLIKAQVVAAHLIASQVKGPKARVAIQKEVQRSIVSNTKEVMEV